MGRIIKKQRAVICIVLAFVLLTTIYYKIVEHQVSKSNGITIVLDAGHGGRDGGSVGVNGTIEKEINLDYTLSLKDKLVDNGFNVVLTRKNDDGLYAELAKNKKQSDMNARYKIIEQANPNLVISIHMNSFVSPLARGAVAYYKNDDPASKRCADYIQKSLNKYCDAKIDQAKVGDYFMLNCSYYTSILIECGFISNPEEEKKLNTESYKELMVDSIYKGILLYFGNNHV